MLERNLNTQLKDLLTTHHALTAKQILSLLDEDGRQYNKTSVYRALERLLSDGEVCQHYFMNNEAWFELRDHHHAHLVCESCGKVTTAECQYSQPASLEGYQLRHHHLTIFGVCASCQKSE